jgi:hypothetical protein
MVNSPELVLGEALGPAEIVAVGDAETAVKHVLRRR